ncbi:response regulator SirA, partial [candidate division WWE3 bacterium]|nr:response regulator SirA [candidate division WWE3 bacterium]
MKFHNVIKQSGDKQPFNSSKIADSIYKAATKVGGKDKSLADNIAIEVIALLEERYPTQREITTEEIGNSVEKVLIENGHAKTAKEFI